MASNLIQIYIPCDIVAVRVRVGPQEHLSPLEELFLRAVHGGLHNFEELDHLFHIGHRPTLDLVFDLWHRGYLFLDLSRRMVLVSPEVSQRIGQGTLGQLSSGEMIDEVREVLLDKLTGHVLPLIGQTRRPEDDATIIPIFSVSTIGPQDVSTAALLSALRRTAVRENTEERPKRIISAHLSFAELSVKQRWLPVTISSAENEAGLLSIQVAETTVIPASMKTEIARKLPLLIEEQPDSLFANFVRASATGQLREPPDFEDHLTQLEARVARLAEVGEGLVEQVHQDLVALATTTEDWLRSQQGFNVQVRLIRHGDHYATIVDLLETAERQVVIVSPWIRYDDLAVLLIPLRDTLKRGVQVFLLWGITSAAELDQKVRNAFLLLFEEFPATFFVSTNSGSSRTHAKLVIQDDRRALVSSLNLLQKSASETFELGALITPSDPESPSLVIEELLGWAQDAYPDYTQSRSIYTRHEDFQPSRAGLTPSLSSVPPLPHLTGWEGRSSSNRDENLTPVAFHLWQQGWSDYVQAVRRASQTGEIVAGVLRDGQHHTELWRGLQRATQRLLIMSDQMGPEVVDDRFLQALEGRLKAGVAIVLIYRRAASFSVGPDADPAGRVESLRIRFPHLLQVLANKNSHAKVLVADDRAVIGSFNFLSFEGYYDQRSSGSRRRQRSEISLLLRGSDVATSVLQEVAQRFPEVATLTSRDTDGATIASATPARAEPLALIEDPNRLLHTVLSASTLEQQMAQLQQEVVASKHPAALLKRLYDAGLPKRLLRPIVSGYLASRPLAALGPDERNWLRWLIQTTWENRDFVPAAILAHAVPDLRDPATPSPVLTYLAASRASVRFGSVLEELSVGEDLSDAERLTLAVVALVDLMLHGTIEASDAVEMHGSTLSPAWAGVQQAFSHYWTATYAPLPLDRMITDLASADLDHGVAQAWETLEASLARGEAHHFKFVSGTKTHEYLFQEGHAFGRLRTLVSNRDAQGVREWLASEDMTDLGNYLDSATEAATGRNDQMLDPRKNNKRKFYIKSLADIREAAERVADLEPPDPDEGWTANLDEIREVAKLISREWPNLQHEISELPQPERILLHTVLEELEPVRAWGNL